jgi:hypothetical protein
VRTKLLYELYCNVSTSQFQTESRTAAQNFEQ